MGAVASFVSNAVSAVGNAVTKVVSFVGNTVTNVVKGAIQNPVKTLATIAAYALAPATGGLSLTIGLPVISAVDTIAHGGNIGQALLSAGAAYAGSAIAGSDFVSGALTDTVGAGAAKEMIQGAIRGAVPAAITGKDIVTGALTGAAAAGIGGVVNDFGVKDYLGASLGAGAGYLASNTLTDTLRGGLTSALKGKSFEEGAEQGASKGILGGFMDNLSDLGGSAKEYFGDLYKSNVEPLYNAQVNLQQELSDKGTALQELQGQYKDAYTTYNDSATKTQAAADDYNTKVTEFNDLKSQYDAAVAAGDTEKANSLADQANAKADEATKSYDSYTKLSDEFTKNETAVTDLQNKYQTDSEALKQGVLTYQGNLGKLKEAADPIVAAQQQAQENWYKTVGSDATGAITGEKTFDDGSKIQTFDDGSQIITQSDGTKVVYNDDGSVFTPSGQEAVTPGDSQAINWGKALFSSAATANPATGRLKTTSQKLGSARQNNAQSGVGSGAIGLAGAAGVGAASASSPEENVRSSNARSTDPTDTSNIEGNTNYNLGYDTDYGKGLGTAKQIAIPGVNAPNVKPEEQYLTFGQDQAVANRPKSDQQNSNFDYLAQNENDSSQATMKRGGMVSRETIEREAPVFMSEGSLANRHVKGDGDGTSDDVPALLARDEYVLSSDIVSHLGNGSSDAGAEKLDKFVQAVRSHKRKAAPDKLAPDAKEIHQYFKGGLA